MSFHIRKHANNSASVVTSCGVVSVVIWSSSRKKGGRCGPGCIVFEHVWRYIQGSQRGIDGQGTKDGSHGGHFESTQIQRQRGQGCIAYQSLGKGFGTVGDRGQSSPIFALVFSFLCQMRGTVITVVHQLLLDGIFFFGSRGKQLRLGGKIQTFQCSMVPQQIGQWQ